MDICEIYEIKKAAEAEVNDILKGFTLATGMQVEGMRIIQIDAEKKVNTDYVTHIEVKL